MSKNTLTADDVLHVARLCNLDISEEQTIKLTSILAETLDYIEVLDELDIKNIPETYQVTGLTNIFQKETDTSNTLSQEDATSNAKNRTRGLFATKAVFQR